MFETGGVAEKKQLTIYSVVKSVSGLEPQYELKKPIFWV